MTWNDHVKQARKHVSRIQLTESKIGQLALNAVALHPERTIEDFAKDIGVDGACLKAWCDRVKAALSTKAAISLKSKRPVKVSFVHQNNIAKDIADFLAENYTALTREELHKQSTARLRRLCVKVIQLIDERSN